MGKWRVVQSEQWEELLAVSSRDARDIVYSLRERNALLERVAEAAREWAAVSDGKVGVRNGRALKDALAALDELSQEQSNGE